MQAMVSLVTGPARGRFARLLVLSLLLAAGSAPGQEVAQPSAARQQYEAKLQQWKTLLKDLRRLREQYQSAPDSEAARYQEEWEKSMANGRQVLQQLRAAAVEAYRDAPNTDKDLAQFLVSLAKDDVASDRYEQAMELCSLLIDHQCEQNEVYRQAGIAAFSTHDFDKAVNYLGKAAELGLLEPEQEQLLQEAEQYRQLWKREQELRQKEAAADDLPRVRLTTTKGDIVLELFENEAPDTVGNFISLVENKFYDGTIFHRVLAGFMAQGGDPDGTGFGGPGYKIYDECRDENYRRHFRGSFSMAHAGPNTGGSQFFLTFRPTPHLNGVHTVFGRVIEGLDVLPQLQRINPEQANPSLKPDRIIKAEVIRKRDHEYQPRKVE